jgi:hypothetical protein
MTRRSLPAILVALAVGIAVVAVPALARRRTVTTTLRLERRADGTVRAAPDRARAEGGLTVTAGVDSGAQGDSTAAAPQDAGGAFQTYAFVNSKQLSSSVIAANDAVIVKGRAQPSQLALAGAPGARAFLVNYEQAAALNSTEASYAEAHGYLAQTCSGELIHPRNIPQVTLMDLTNPAALQWRAAMISDETATGYDQTYLDTLGSYFRDAHYTGHPCHDGVPVTNEEWRDASIALVQAVKANTGKPVIANGAGLGSGGGYFRHQADSDLLIAAADGVQIEHFARNNTEKDVQFLQIAQARGKSVFAKCDASFESCSAAFAPVAGPSAYLAAP